LDSHEAIEITLTDKERRILLAGLLEWGGPAHPTEELAAAMGFKSVEDLLSQRDRLAQALVRKEPLTRLDWGRTLLATELAFVSDLIGSGVEWSTTTGLSDPESMKLLRAVQRKMAGLGVGDLWGRRRQ